MTKKFLDAFEHVLIND